MRFLALPLTKKALRWQGFKSQKIIKPQKLNRMNKDENLQVSPTFGNTVLPAVPAFDYIKCPLHRYTFSVKPIREWTERNCEGKTLNLLQVEQN